MNLDIIKFNLEDASKIFEKLKIFYDAYEINNWKNKLLNDLDSLFIKYNICDYKLNEKSYMGVVIDCKTIDNGEIYIKIVPPMIGRYENEVSTLKLLPNDLICKIYEFDYEKKAIIMEKVIPGSNVDFLNNQDDLKKLFNKLYNNKIKDENSINYHFNDFFDVVEHDYNICIKSRLANMPIVNKLYDEFKKEYKQICVKEEKFILHGDIYKNNILLSDNGVKIIDPLGFKAPFVMELVSICAYEMFFDNKENYKNILEKFITFFSDLVEENLYKKALFCELVKVYIPSIYEANDNGVRAGKWYEIISILYPEKIGELE